MKRTYADSSPRLSHELLHSDLQRVLGRLRVVKLLTHIRKLDVVNYSFAGGGSFTRIWLRP